MDFFLIDNVRNCIHLQRAVILVHIVFFAVLCCVSLSGLFINCVISLEGFATPTTHLYLAYAKSYVYFPDIIPPMHLDRIIPFRY